MSSNLLLKANEETCKKSLWAFRILNTEDDTCFIDSECQLVEIENATHVFDVKQCYQILSLKTRSRLDIILELEEQDKFYIVSFQKNLTNYEQPTIDFLLGYYRLTALPLYKSWLGFNVHGLTTKEFQAKTTALKFLSTTIMDIRRTYEDILAKQSPLDVVEEYYSIINGSIKIPGKVFINLDYRRNTESILWISNHDLNLLIDNKLLLTIS